MPLVQLWHTQYVYTYSVGMITLTQICGYGHSAVYHGENEYCTVENMANGLKILGLIIAKCSKASA